MIQLPDDSGFPQQDGSEKIHGVPESEGKEKYLREAGKIEDLPESQSVKNEKASIKNQTAHLTDNSGEEEKEDYINTDERQKDLNQRSS